MSASSVVLDQSKVPACSVTSRSSAVTTNTISAWMRVISATSALRSVPLSPGSSSIASPVGSAAATDCRVASVLAAVARLLRVTPTRSSSARSRPGSDTSTVSRQCGQKSSLLPSSGSYSMLNE
ncbi:MAG: hypothetical protein M5U28_31190 [Sandaracinaceae bacterium]|nr:hypothetical protein [Sandaracinaceae bacterium]